MLTLPAEYITILTTLAPVFSRRVWLQVQVLLLGAILAPGQRTVTAVLRIMGLSMEKHFQNYQRVLNRAVWSNRVGRSGITQFERQTRTIKTDNAFIGLKS
jgi:hypothetical protein